MLAGLDFIMGIHHLIISALLVSALVLAKVELSTSYVLKGSVHCLDCKYTHDDHDLSGLFSNVLNVNSLLFLASTQTQY